MMTDRANLRVDPEKWEEFRNLCTDQGTNASAAINFFIELAVQIKTVRPWESPLAIASAEIEGLKAAIARLEREIKELRGEIGESYSAAIGQIDGAIAQLREELQGEAKPGKSIAAWVKGWGELSLFQSATDVLPLLAG